MPRAERLSSVKDIESLFRQGEAFLAYPIRCVWCWGEPLNAEGQVADSGVEQLGGSVKTVCRVMVSAPKRNHKKAVTRNLLKRRMRESYRLNKGAICDSLSIKKSHCLELHLSFGYVAKEVADYATIEQSIKKCIEKVSQKISQTIGDSAAGGIG